MTYIRIITLILSLATSLLSRAESCNIAARQDYNILALTWISGYCVSEFSKPICNSRLRYSVDHNFVAHGLWPANSDCGNKYNFCQNQIGLDKLSEEVKMTLKKYMFSDSLKDGFINYQWQKHGTCAGLSPDIYFSQIVSLTKAFNHSLFKQNLLKSGNKIKNTRDIYRLFEQNFGSGSGKFLSLRCSKFKGNRKILREIQISLPQALPEDSSFSLKDLIAKSQKSLPKGNCGDLFFIE